MKVYVAMVCDRHADPKPYVFTTAEAAVEFARETAQEYATDPDDIKEETIDGWLYYARYSVEDDAVWVVEKETDAS